MKQVLWTMAILGVMVAPVSADIVEGGFEGSTILGNHDINPSDDNGDGWHEVNWGGDVNVIDEANDYLRMGYNGTASGTVAVGQAVAGTAISGAGSSAVLTLDYNLYQSFNSPDITDTTIRVVIVGHNVDGFPSNNRLNVNRGLAVTDGASYNEILIDTTFDLCDVDTTGFTASITTGTFDATAYGSYSIGIAGENIQWQNSTAREHLEIDNVTITPEPATAVLALAGLGAILSRRRYI